MPYLHIEIDSNNWNPMCNVLIDKSTNIDYRNGAFFKKDLTLETIVHLSKEKVTSSLKKNLGVFFINGTEIKVIDNGINSITNENIENFESNFARIDRPMSDLVIEITKYKKQNGYITFDFEDIKNISLKFISHLSRSVKINPVLDIDKGSLFSLDTQLTSKCSISI